MCVLLPPPPLVKSFRPISLKKRKEEKKRRKEEKKRRKCWKNEEVHVHLHHRGPGRRGEEVERRSRGGREEVEREEDIQ